MSTKCVLLFKQKTGYEMRISDWSSYVCSSDLPTIAQLLELKRELADTGGDFAPSRLDREFVIAGSDVGQLIVLTSLYDAVRDEAPGEIGRASCREGVWQYV